MCIRFTEMFFPATQFQIYQPRTSDYSGAAKDY